MPLRPCEAMTIRSHFSFFAMRIMASAGALTRVVTPMNGTPAFAQARSMAAIYLAPIISASRSNASIVEAGIGVGSA